MSNRITFQFDDHLDYQLQAIQSVVDLFSGLQKNSSSLYKTQHTHGLMKNVAVRNPGIVVDSRLKTNLNRVQLGNDLFADHNLEPNHNFTIEMETGERVIIVTGCINVFKSRVSGTLAKYNSCIA